MKLLIIVCTLMSIAVAFPGLLRVPKVYNAVISSNQNLSPSRAFPVIQPIIHRTAIGYVPPFYYTQIAPHFGTGSEMVARYPSLGTVDDKIIGNDQASSSTSRLIESTSFGIGKERNEDRANAEKNDSRNNDPSRKDSSKNSSKKNEPVPLTFIPNYQSLYYKPYIYTYNGFNPHLAPGTYYIDYLPYRSLEPIPATTPRNADSGYLLPSFYDEKRDRTREDDKEKIPNVPPPPLPTSVPKKS